ncbi:hypothetical protein PIB30_013520 [Stylosanthes scabra]|uniref:DUF4283 domain-containing protein n=1 Tax=Stylosanthes scabra TaxID=79078 RepID=A0ABU6R679_9FABA|nr:hypothetical protein [Stylosanthes scabra]
MEGRSNKPMFAFIKFGKETYARRAMQRLDGWIVWGCRLRISKALHYRRTSIHARDRKNDQPEKTNEDVLIGKHSGDGEIPFGDVGVVTDLGSSKLKLDRDAVMAEKMERSLVGETMESIDFEKGEHGGGAKFSIYAESLYEERQWEVREACRTRKFWIEASRIPCHDWTVENMRRVSEVWGRVLELKELEAERLDAFYVLVESNHGPYVQSWLEVTIEEVEFRMFVKEIAMGGMMQKVIALNGADVAKNGAVVTMGNNTTKETPEKIVETSPEGIRNESDKRLS